MFAVLIPDDSVLTSNPPIHILYVHVYAIHQNAKLKLNATQYQLKTKNMIKKAVCSANNKFCVFRN